MEHLIDGDVGSNNGGWQWVAGHRARTRTTTRASSTRRCSRSASTPTAATCAAGCPSWRGVPDALPGQAVGDSDEPPAGYPPPIVDHAVERKRAIEAYRAVRG